MIGTFISPVLGQETKSFTYEKAKQADLEIIVHYPPGWKATDKRPGIVFFFGGGWTGGTVEQFVPYAKHLANRGMVAARADYLYHGGNSETVVGKALVGGYPGQFPALQQRHRVQGQQRHALPEPLRLLAGSGKGDGMCGVRNLRRKMSARHRDRKYDRAGARAVCLIAMPPSQ